MGIHKELVVNMRHLEGVDEVVQLSYSLFLEKFKLTPYSLFLSEVCQILIIKIFHDSV